LNRYTHRKSKIEPEPGSEDVTRADDITGPQHEVLDYMLLGFATERIAKETNRSIAAIETDIEAIEKISLSERSEDLGIIRQEVVAKLRYTWDQGATQFNESKGSQEKVTEFENEHGQVESRKVETNHTPADPRWLREMNDSAEKMAKVTGAQRHKEVQINNDIDNRSVSITSPDRSKLPTEYDELLGVDVDNDND
jgi:hypothetical protein